MTEKEKKKRCSHCRKNKDLIHFGVLLNTPHGQRYCKPCDKVIRQAAHRTKRGHIRKIYSCMVARTNPNNKSLKCMPYYIGIKVLVKREDFITWAEKNITYIALYKEWAKQNYSRKYTPSIDRIDSDGHYELSNLRWLALSEHMTNTRLDTNKKQFRKIKQNAYTVR